MVLNAIVIILVGMALAFVRGAEENPCSSGIISLSVTTAAGLQDFRDAMNCSGEGFFHVSWNSSLVIEERIEVTDFKTVRITGTGHQTASNGLPGSGDAGAVISGGSTTGIFLVSNGSSLTISNLVLEEGYSEDEGAIAVHSSSFLQVSACTFTNNKASIGGAIYANNSEVHIDGATSFMNNYAGSGGSVYADVGSEFIVGGNTSFAHNSASLSGGAIYTNGGNVHMGEATSFDNNSADVGGAIFADGESEIDIEGETSFTSNSASASGGAIGASESGVHIVGEAVFSHNSAVFRGGAIHASRSVIYTDGGTYVGNNDARYGGGINSFESKVFINGKTSFVRNSAAQDGGGILANFGSEISIDGKSYYADNKACGEGGSLYSFASQVNMSGSISITNSVAFTGGGIHCSESNITISGTASFSSNSANFTGGAIHADRAMVHIAGNISFSANVASVAGGAIVTQRASDTSIDGATRFHGNSAQLGGAIATANSRLTIGGTTWFDANSALDAGALYVTESEVNMYGTASFDNNLASAYGGAMYIRQGSEVHIIGSTTFADNSATERGGAVCTNGDNIHINGTTVFSNNSAAHGGAIAGQNTTIDFDSITNFVRNWATADGGAVYAVWGCEINFYGNVSFDGNQADSGGAIAATDTDIRIYSSTLFSANSATIKGGAIQQKDSDLSIVADAVFEGNSAAFGGGIFIFGGNIHIAGGASFIGNVAEASGGGISITAPNSTIMSSLKFSSNTATLGGAIALGSPENNDRVYDQCTFIDNKALDGGAMYLFGDAGVDIINSSVFRGNHASVSGGAVYLVGSAVLEDTILAANTAGKDGAAITSVSVSSKVGFTNVSFHNNTPHCPLGFYGDTVAGMNVSRFDTVCGGCATVANNVLDGVNIDQDSGTPTCMRPPPGTVASASGTTAETLTLEKGFYRTSNKSVVVLECHRRESCEGGSEPGKLCAEGYGGAYCAVCAKGFSPGMAYSCTKCSGRTKKSGVGVAVTSVIIVSVVAVMLLRYLGRAEDDDTRGRRGASRGFLRQKCDIFQESLSKVLPLTAIKMVVVVWQIVLQFSAIAGDVYPEEYEEFLSYLSFVNFDLGVMSSYSCLFSHDFYGRLLFATIAPLVVLAVLAYASHFAQRRYKDSSRRMDEVRGKHVSAALFVSFFVYSSVSYTVLQTYICDSLDDGEEYLQADYSLKCSTQRHIAYTAYASLMVIIYPVGIPAVFLWWLVRNRKHLQMPDRQAIAHIKPFSNIWGTYRPSRYYYEVVEFCRRMTLTMASVFLIPNTVNQITIVLSLGVAFLFLSESMSPFENRRDMKLYRWGNGVVLASMYVALLIKANNSNDKSGLVSVFGVVLIIANVFMVVSVLIQTVLAAKAWHVTMPKADMGVPDFSTANGVA